MILALVHSPLTGPLMFDPAQAELARRGVRATIPEVADHPSGTGAYFEQHARSVARSLRGVEDVVLVAHSGAGQLLPAVREALGRDVGGYLFVDAAIPEDGLSRLEQIRRENPAAGADFERHLRAGGRFPDWTDDDLRQVIPNDGLRRGAREELRPRPLEFFVEPIRVFEGWPDAPCGYLRLSPAYDPALARANALRWPTRSLDAGHFHLLVEPRATVEAILDLLQEM